MMAKAPTNAELQGQVTLLGQQKADLIEKLKAADDSSERQADALAAAKARLKEQAERIEALEAELRDTFNSLKAYKGSATKARAELLILRGEKSPQARKIGAPAPAKGATGDEIAAAGARRRAAIEDALRDGPVTIVFSDGRMELRELAPLIVTGPAFRRTAKADILDAEILLEPGDMARPSVAIAGVAMLDEAGDQIAWGPFPEAITVARGARVMLPKGSILF